MTVTGLPNTKEEKTLVVIRRVWDAIPLIRTGRVASLTGDNGLACVWYDDSQALRGELKRNNVVIESLTFKDIAEMRPWLLKQAKKL